ncbi:ABC transporter substrate-binding protein [Ruania alba]|uniref:Carbohydrate ABC transporter substrate-binding protein, CUT1 family n=1 Tax=Ruania alba TaxID=648782 RepID=A0A1H5NCW0_9MICO|nr:extracellular solute-binding protein [Ruania alba]SEE99290.1 carbohydrate ABC transporter substrate-binding protein, CUT1 family [Ruania alba]
MRRRTLAAATTAVAAVMLAACTQGSQTADSGENTLDYIGDEAAVLPQITAAADAVEEVTELQFESRTVQSTENYQQVIRSSLTSDSAPDLLKWWNGYRLQELARSDGLLDITAQWDEAVENGWLDDSTRDAFSYDGSVYAMPFDASYWVVYYNRGVYDELGLEVPTTWDEFMSNAQTIADADITPFFATIDGGWTSFIWYEELLSKSDPQLYMDLTSGAASYTDPGSREVMELWLDMYDRGFFTPADTPWADEPAMLASGNVAMTVAGAWRNGAFIEAGLTEDDYGAFVMPTVDEGTTPSVISESGIIAAASGGSQPEDAATWLLNLVGTDAQEAALGESQGMSPNPQVSPPNPVLQSVAEDVAADDYLILTRYWEASPPAIVEGNVQDLAAFMANPSDGSIDSTLASMDERSESGWAEWNE